MRTCVCAYVPVCMCQRSSLILIGWLASKPQWPPVSMLLPQCWVTEDMSARDPNSGLRVCILTIKKPSPQALFSFWTLSSYYTHASFLPLCWRRWDKQLLGKICWLTFWKFHTMLDWSYGLGVYSEDSCSFHSNQEANDRKVCKSPICT